MKPHLSRESRAPRLAMMVVLVVVERLIRGQALRFERRPRVPALLAILFPREVGLAAAPFPGGGSILFVGQ